MTAPQVGASFRWADTAGVIGAIFAALCCAGAPATVGALAAIGLSGLRDDRILWPLMVLFLLLALWGLTRDYRRHRLPGPLLLGWTGALALVAGVMFVHGSLARVLINTGAVALLTGTGWNVWTRARRQTALASDPPIA